MNKDDCKKMLIALYGKWYFTIDCLLPDKPVSIKTMDEKSEHRAMGFASLLNDVLRRRDPVVISEADAVVLIVQVISALGDNRPESIARVTSICTTFGGLARVFIMHALQIYSLNDAQRFIEAAASVELAWDNDDVSMRWVVPTLYSSPSELMRAAHTFWDRVGSNDDMIIFILLLTLRNDFHASQMEDLCGLFASVGLAYKGKEAEYTAMFLEARAELGRRYQSIFGS